MHLNWHPSGDLFYLVTLVEQYSMITDTFLRCLTTIHRMNLERGWRLSEAEQSNYAINLSKLITEQSTDLQLELTICNYHDDHVHVDALQDSTHIFHVSAWEQVEQRIRQALVSRHLDWSSDSQYEFEDLIQIAHLELLRSIKTFRYACHFSTWAYRVIVDSVRRTVRDSRARKRAGRPDSLDQFDGLRQYVYQIAGPQSDQPAHLVDALELYKLAVSILNKHKDKRLAMVFCLHFISDRSIEEIGERLNLHPSRARTLLVLARTLVRDAPEIQEWRYSVEQSELFRVL